MYAYDPHGNAVSMPHLSELTWSFLDQLASTSRQVVASGTPETTHYVYDATGRRVRKITERHNGTRKTERLYLDDCEVDREYDGSGASVELERETLHVSLGQRVAVVETRTHGTSPGPAQLVRYQLTNHVGSACLEVDATADVISYEEYYPYGSTSYQAVRSQVETPKRYRYTAMERDDETGLAYHGKRYYAPWLARWVSCDPVGIAAGPNLYAYVRSNPIARIDPNGTDDYLPDWYRTPQQLVEVVTELAAIDQLFELTKPRTYGDPAKGPEDGYVVEGISVDPKALSLLAHRKGHLTTLLKLNEAFGDRARDSAARRKWNDDHGWVDKLVTSYEGEKAYRETKAKHRDWEVKSNVVLEITDPIVKATPSAAGDMWSLFTGGMKTLSKPSASGFGRGGGGAGGGAGLAGIIAKDLGGTKPIPGGTNLALGLSSDGLETFARSQKAVSMFTAWEQAFIRVPIGDMRGLRQFFHAVAETFIANGGRLKFNLSGIKTGIEGATTWELQAILKSKALEGKTDFFMNGKQLIGAELEAALKPWR